VVETGGLENRFAPSLPIAQFKGNPFASQRLAPFLISRWFLRFHGF
jgi:hypothetical protein